MYSYWQIFAAHVNHRLHFQVLPQHARLHEHAVSAQAPLVDVIEEGQGDDDEADILVVNETLVGPVRPSHTAGQGSLVRNILEAEKALQVCVGSCT